MRNDVCAQIDDDVVELHIFKRVQDTSIRDHLNTCPDCRARVTEYRSFLSVLRRALQMHLERGQRTDISTTSSSDDS
jgi:hypothetical protein